MIKIKSKFFCKGLYFHPLICFCYSILELLFLNCSLSGALILTRADKVRSIVTIVISCQSAIVNYFKNSQYLH